MRSTSAVVMMAGLRVSPLAPPSRGMERLQLSILLHYGVRPTTIVIVKSMQLYREKNNYHEFKIRRHLNVFDKRLIVQIYRAVCLNKIEHSLLCLLSLLS